MPGAINSKLKHSAYAQSTKDLQTFTILVEKFGAMFGGPVLSMNFWKGSIFARKTGSYLSHDDMLAGLPHTYTAWLYTCDMQ
jgi:hypothetical protein